MNTAPWFLPNHWTVYLLVLVARSGFTMFNHHITSFFIISSERIVRKKWSNHRKKWGITGVSSKQRFVEDVLNQLHLGIATRKTSNYSAAGCCSSQIGLKIVYPTAKSPCLMGKSTISMAIFSSDVSNCQRVIWVIGKFSWGTWWYDLQDVVN